MINFSIFGIPVRVMPFFWVTMALIGGVIGVENTKEAIFELLLFIIAGFISILIHELGHGLVARWYKHQVVIVLQAFGGYAAYQGGNPPTRVQNFLITAAGPATQVLVAIAVYAGASFFAPFQPMGAYFLNTFLAISLIWAVLNLLPVLPMDGGRIMESILGPKRVRLTIQISIGVAIAIGVAALILKAGMLLPMFMGLMAYENYKALSQVPR